MHKFIQSLLNIFLIIVAISLFFCDIKTINALTPSATLSIVPANTVTGVKQPFNVDIKLTSNTNAASAVDLTVNYSPNLTYNSSDSANSIFNTEVDALKNVNNAITFSRIRTDTGYLGTSGQVVRLNFTASKSGLYTISINTGNSSVLAYSDSSNILLSTSNATITVDSAKITLNHSASPASGVTGTVITYTITFSNPGPSPAINAIINSPVPVGTTYVANSASNAGVISGSTITWTVGSVAINASGTRTFQVTIN